MGEDDRAFDEHRRMLQVHYIARAVTAGRPAALATWPALPLLFCLKRHTGTRSVGSPAE